MFSRCYISRMAIAIVLAGLFACSTAPRPQTYWVNPGVSAESRQHRFTLDSTECWALANRMIPDPPAPPPPQTGEITVNTPSGPLYGTYQSQPRATNPFAEGIYQAERRQNRQSYAFACMANRGWQQQNK